MCIQINFTGNRLPTSKQSRSLRSMKNSWIFFLLIIAVLTTSCTNTSFKANCDFTKEEKLEGEKDPNIASKMKQCVENPSVYVIKRF